MKKYIIPDVGSKFYLLNQPWIIMQASYNKLYLMYPCIYDDTAFIKLPQKCKEFESMFTAAELACLEEVTVEGITGKVFVASKAQLDGGFEWFKDGNVSDKRRTNGIYWTSSRYSSRYAWCVDFSGNIGYGYSDFSSFMCGFRPCVCLNVKKYEKICRRPTVTADVM